VQLGATAFSFTNEWLTRRLTLEQVLRRVADLGAGPGIEVIGFQTWRHYPALSSDDVLAFRRLVDELALEPAALGAYVDIARRPDRLMSTDEGVEFLEPQIVLAAKLGFPVLRLHPGVPVAVLEQLAPTAKGAGVTLATEFQGPQSPGDPAVAAVLECRERTGLTSMALALDFSIAMRRVPTAFVASVRRLGMAQSDLDALVALWSDGAPTPVLFAALSDVDAPTVALDEARSGFVRFGRQAPEAWRPLVPHLAYAHAKFWELDETGDDPSVATSEMFDVLRDGGYTGVVASEWGGNAWAEAEDVDAFELVGRHHQLCRSLISTPAVEVPA
jgi:hypothetical protein